MESYPQQFIEAVIKKLDPKLNQFYELKKKVINFKANSFQSLVQNALTTCYKGYMIPDALISVINALKNSRYKKRHRIYKSFMNDIDVLSIDDPQFPLANIVTLARTLTPDKYFIMFGNKSIEDLIADEVKNVEAWKADTHSLFIEFPIISNFSDKNILQMINTDIALNAWNYIYNELDGNINRYFNKYPVYLLDKPIFSSIPIQLFDGEEDTDKDVISDEDGNEILTTSISSNRASSIPYNSLSKADLKIFITILANANMETFCRDRTIVMKKSTLAKSLVSYNPGSYAYDKVKVVCENLLKYDYKWTVGGKTLVFNFFDNILIDDKLNQVIFTFGEVLANDLIEQRLIQIATPDYNALTTSIAQIICYAMKREQIAHQQSLNAIYSYSFFQKNIRFASKSKKNNIKLLKEALQDFIENKIIIKQYHVDSNGTFTIQFLKLSDTEIEDFGLDYEQFLIAAKD